MRKCYYFLFVIFLSILTSCGVQKEPVFIKEEAISIDSPTFNNTDVFEITYESDDLLISGFMLKPKEINGKLPVVIFNHGGILDTEIGIEELETLAFWPNNGYILLASQYRGVGGSEGEYSFGEGDVRDALQLMNVVEEIESADTDNIFMYGMSRGGMVTYQALKETNNIKAAATIGGISDLVSGYEAAPFSLQYFLEETLGDFHQNVEVYESRSAIYWPEKIETPLLLIHAKGDPTIPVSQTSNLFDKLKETNEQVEMSLYDINDHMLTDKSEAYLTEISSWFQKYME